MHVPTADMQLSWVGGYQLTFLLFLFLAVTQKFCTNLRHRPPPPQKMCNFESCQEGPFFPSPAAKRADSEMARVYLLSFCPPRRNVSFWEVQKLNCVSVGSL